MTVKKKRLVYLDALRIIAIFLVVFNHQPGFILYQTSDGVMQLIYMIISMLDKIAVPLFFMISGTLLLGKDETYSELIRKRILRFIVVILIFTSMIYAVCIITSYEGRTDWSLTELVHGFFSGKTPGTVSYWYLYAYLGMLLMLPMLRKTAKHLTRNDMYFLLFLRFFFASFIPLFNSVLSIFKIAGISFSSSLSIPLAMTDAFFYPLVGYYISHFIDTDKFRKKDILIIALSCLIGMSLACICTYYEGETSGHYTQNFTHLFDYLFAIVTFIFVKHIFSVNNIKITIKKNIIACGRLTFGIYLLEPFLGIAFYPRMKSILEPMMPTIFISLIWCLFSMIVCGSVTWILKKIPYLDKLL